MFCLCGRAPVFLFSSPPTASRLSSLPCTRPPFLLAWRGATRNGEGDLSPPPTPVRCQLGVSYNSPPYQVKRPSPLEPKTPPCAIRDEDPGSQGDIWIGHLLTLRESGSHAKGRPERPASLALTGSAQTRHSAQAKGPAHIMPWGAGTV